MKPAALLAAIEAEGLTLSLEAGDLRARGPAHVIRQWGAAIRAGKAGLVEIMTPRHRWLVTHANGLLVSHSYTPHPVSLAEVAAEYPDAVSIEPEDDDDE